MSDSTDKTLVLLLKTRTTPDGYEEYFSQPQSTYRPVFVPVLEHRFIRDALEALITGLGSEEDVTSGRSHKCSYGGIIFTSQRAVEAFASVVDAIRTRNSHCDREPIDPQLPLYVVGPATARSLRTIGLSNMILGEESGTGEVLAGFMLRHYNALHSDSPSAKRPLLFMVGEQRRDIIPKTLQSAALSDEERIRVDEVTVYETGVMDSFSDHFAQVIKPYVTRQKRLWAVVFSPTGCKAMLEGLDMLDPSTGKVRSSVRRVKRRAFVVTIGPTTRDYLVQEFDFTPDICAQSPTPAGVGDAIRHFEKTLDDI